MISYAVVTLLESTVYGLSGSCDAICEVLCTVSQAVVTPFARYCVRSLRQL